MGGNGAKGKKGGGGGSRSFDTKSIGINVDDSTARNIDTFVNRSIQGKFTGDATSFEANISPNDRQKLSAAIQKQFKSNLGWNVDVNIRRRAEAGTRSRIRGGGKKGKTYYTTISYGRR